MFQFLNSFKMFWGVVYTKSGVYKDDRTKHHRYEEHPIYHSPCHIASNFL